MRGRTAKAPTRWLLGRPRGWRAGSRWAVLDLSGPYRTAFNGAVLDRSRTRSTSCGWDDALDDVRRRVRRRAAAKTSTGRASCYDITENGHTRRHRPLTWAKAAAIYDIADHQLGIDEPTRRRPPGRPASPTEINRLGRTIDRLENPSAPADPIKRHAAPPNTKPTAPPHST